jgi:hypothetical protein
MGRWKNMKNQQQNNHTNQEVSDKARPFLEPSTP